MADISPKYANLSSTSGGVDGASDVAGMGKQKDLYVSEVRGKFATAGYRGNAFTTSVPAATALTIPTTLATLASKFCLVNPAGNTKYFELVRLDVFVNSATEVVNTLGFTKSTLTAAALATLTAGVINNTTPGNPNNLAPTAIFYNAATHADTPVWFKSLIGIDATAVGIPVNSYVFDGTMHLYPGNCLDLVASVGAQANCIPDLVWLEWPM